MSSSVMMSELMSEEEWNMLKEEEVEEKMKEEVNGEVAGIPKPSFFLNLVTNIEGGQKCPARKKKAKKTPHFPIFAISKRRLCMEEGEEEVSMMGLKKLKVDLLEEEMKQLDILLANFHPCGKM